MTRSLANTRMPSAVNSPASALDSATIAFA